jgi:hypothetical protein
VKVSRTGALIKKRADRLSSEESHLQNRAAIALNRALLGRRLCLGKNGYIGLVPAWTEIGDTIAVIHGGQVFYVPRPKAASEGPSPSKCPFHDVATQDYEFVGECYLHGLMDGEAAAANPEGSVNCLRLT